MNPLTNPIQPNAVRDAIHIAIAPVIANEGLKPGEHIGFALGSTTHMERSDSPIGIVNPFGKRVVKGESFYLCLYPDTVTDMKHHWSHPAFSAAPADTNPFSPATKAVSEAWLISFCKRYGLSMDYLLRGLASEYPGLCVYEDSVDDGYSEQEDLWKHYQIFTGNEVSEVKKDNLLFRCAC